MYDIMIVFFFLVYLVCAVLARHLDYIEFYPIKNDTADVHQYVGTLLEDNSAKYAQTKSTQCTFIVRWG